MNKLEIEIDDDKENEEENDFYEEIINFFNNPFKNYLNEEHDISYNKWINKDNNLQFLCSYFKIPKSEEEIKKIIKRRDYSCELKLLKWITEDIEHKQTCIKISNTKTKLNRHNDILPYKYNCVTTNNEIPNENNYVNASLIEGPFKEDKNLFIATQGPLSGTLFSFWSMVIFHKINLIIMLSNIIEEGREKSECYWPIDKEKDLILQNENNEKISISLINEKIEIQDSLLIRTLKINEEKEITQIHILCWNDHDIIKDELLFKKILNFLINNINDNRINFPDIPILIHCSAGVGRTGTFIAIYQIIKCLEKIKLLKKEPILNVFNVVRKLREQRYSMVTDVIQYQLIYTFCINWVKDNIFVD